MQDNFDLANNIALRPIDSFPKEVIKNAKLVSISDQPLTYDLDKSAVPFGSATYRAQKYPGDVDIHEKVIGTNVDEVVEEFAKIMKERIRKINSLKDHWITEIKAGIDKRFDFPIGKLLSNNWQPTPEQLNNICGVYKFLKVAEKAELTRILRKGNYLGAEDYSIVSEMLRNLKVLRWSGPEVLKGELMHFGRKIKFTTALRDEASVKIDMVTNISDLFIEVTNFFFLGAIIDNKLHFINTSYDFNSQVETLKNYETSLKGDIEKLIYSSYHYNPFKGAKRMWAFSRTMYKAGNLEFAKHIEKLFDLVTGNISLMYQIKSTIGTFLLVADKMSKRAFDEEYPKFVERLRLMLSNVTQINNTGLQMIYDMIDDGNLSGVVDILKQIINDATCAQLKQIGYWPIPRVFLPEVRGYVS